MSARLAIYRPTPEDIEYRKLEEAANCDWCRWSSNFGTTCAEPVVRHEGAYVRDINPKGECPRYSQSRGTRMLRWVGLRDPAWLPRKAAP